MASDDSTSDSKKSVKSSTAEGLKKRARIKKVKVMVAHEMPSSRKNQIKLAMEKHVAKSANSNWDRISGHKTHKFQKKRVKPGTMKTIKMPLLDVKIGDDWATSVTVIHGSRPGPVITVCGGLHGDELTGPSAASHLLSTMVCGEGGPLNPDSVAGTIRIAPILNPPGYLSKSRYFPDGRDINREFPGSPESNTTSRVANMIWNELIKDSDYLIDLHSAARGRSNMPQVRANLGHPPSMKIAKSSGLEVILDSRPPKGSLRRLANDNGIGAITYEGGGANFLDHESIKVAVFGVLNILKSLHVIPGNPQRPRFRLLASGSNWVRANEGGLLDMLVKPSSFVHEGQIIATINDPQLPGASSNIVSPSTGLMICTAIHPFVTAGTPVGHILPLKKYAKMIMSQCNSERLLKVEGSLETPPWREEGDVDEISIKGEWSGGSVDAEWESDWQVIERDSSKLEAFAEEEGQ